MTPLAAERPRCCVFELTLACNARCTHCGSSAGEPRDDELSSTEALDVIEQLAGLGCESVTLSGGEPLLRKDWPELAGAVRRLGMRADLITNGLMVPELVKAIAEAQFSSVTFSVDGPTEVHERLRNVSGGLCRLLKGARALAGHGVRVGAVTQVNKLNLDRLDDTHEILTANGFEAWQVQLTVPQGRAAEAGSGLCLAPRELPRLEAKLLELFAATPLLMQPADNIGYMSRNEPRFRAGNYAKSQVWTGCKAGLQVLGITSDGTVRGCLSMAPHLDEGSLRERSLREIWNDPKAFSYNRSSDAHRLLDGCANCPFGTVCRGGCKGLALAATGDTRSNPYCLFQVHNCNDSGAV